jgi:LacI family transcriptional regulator
VTEDWAGDGILGLITSPKDYLALQPFRSLPIVDVSMGWIYHLPAEMRRAGKRVARVVYDNRAIGRLAAEHLLERGFKDLAIFNFGNYWFESERMAEYRRTIEAAGARFHEIQYYRHFEAASSEIARHRVEAVQWLNEQIRTLPKPLGILVTADDLAFRIFRACAAADVMVPEEVAILGVDNDSLVCDFAPIPLSSVDSSWEMVGYEAAKMLDRLIRGEAAPRDPVIIPPSDVVTRMSTNVLAVPHPKVARAIRYIWEHFREPIQIQDLARVCGLTRRALERSISKHLNRSIAAEIAHCRIQYAKKLLVESDAKAHEIAEQSGFNNIVNFSNVFLRVEGVRPSEYRRLHMVSK